MASYTSAEARRFAEDWLPAWSGNRPEFLQFNREGKIRRNEVYFDRSELLMEIAKNRAESKLSRTGQTKNGDQKSST